VCVVVRRDNRAKETVKLTDLTAGANTRPRLIST